MAKKWIFCTNLYENPRIIEGKPVDNKFLDTKMNLPIIKTANSKPANSQGSLVQGDFLYLSRVNLVISQEPVNQIIWNVYPDENKKKRFQNLFFF